MRTRHFQDTRDTRRQSHYYVNFFRRRWASCLIWLRLSLIDLMQQTKTERNISKKFVNTENRIGHGWQTLAAHDWIIYEPSDVSNKIIGYRVKEITFQGLIGHFIVYLILGNMLKRCWFRFSTFNRAVLLLNSRRYSILCKKLYINSFE